jgi:SAM-dependent methyltransferase
VYTLENSRIEHERLRAQSVGLHAHTAALLDRVKIDSGATALDLACGTGGALDQLSEHVGPAGRVVGLDIDQRNVSSARAFVRRTRLSNVEIVRGDARSTGCATASLDLVHTRLLLANIPSPEQVVSEMARLLRPRGWVAVLEPDVGLRVCQPPHRSLDRLAELLAASYRLEGADPHVGRRLPHMLANAGLVEIAVQARAEVCPPGHTQRLVVPDLVQNMRPKILSEGLISERELARLDRAARRRLAERETFSIPVTYFLAWARKPGHDG